MFNALLDGRTLVQRIKEAKELLIENGYLVKEPIKAKEVGTPAQLVRFFYDTMALCNPKFKMVYAGNVQRERAIAKRMIEARMLLGVNRERAIAECCQLITTLFEYEEYIGISFKVTSMGVLGLDSMSWVTEKVWQLYEGMNRQLNADEDAKWYDHIYNRQEEQNREQELKAAKQRMDKIMERHDNE